MTCSLDCGETVHARGWCEKHYRRWLRHGDPTVLLKRPARGIECSQCPRESKARGMCEKHYKRWRRYGDSSIVSEFRTVVQGGTVRRSLGSVGEFALLDAS